MGPVRVGRDRRLVLYTTGLGRSVAKGDPVHWRVRGALLVHRGVLRPDFLHRPENGAQVPGHREQQPAEHDIGKTVGRHGLLHTQDSFQGTRDIHRLGHRVQHGHRHMFHHRLERTELSLSERHRRRSQFFRTRRELFANILL